jgi:simple sugar transport system substrate-binding protein
MRRIQWLTVVVAAVLLSVGAAACGGDEEGAAPAPAPAPPAGETAPTATDTVELTQEGDINIAVVTHGGVGDAFWDVVKNGADQAGSDLGVTVTYQSDGDATVQAQLIDTAVSQGVSGLVVSMADPDALQESIQNAVAAGIPVITINSGDDRSREFGAIAHVGQTETVAGQGAGEQLAAAGVTKLLCVLHEEGNVGLEQRCAGATETLGGEVENFQVPGVDDIPGTTEQLTAKLQSDSSINGVLALNAAIAIAARDAVSASGSQAQVATFDLNADAVEAIEAGEILFAVDQQQYLQGYLPVVFLYLYATNGNTVGGGLPVLTGPGFVTADNAAQVAELAAGGTR